MYSNHMDKIYRCTCIYIQVHVVSFIVTSAIEGTCTCTCSNNITVTITSNTDGHKKGEQFESEYDEEE